MAHFAQLDQDGIITQVIVINNDVLIDDTGEESENLGIAFCQSLFGADSRWLQTSYNGNTRKRYAGIGYQYNETLDAFISPKQYDSWVLNEETADWEPPVPMPMEALLEGCRYSWDEETLNWVVQGEIDG